MANQARFTAPDQEVTSDERQVHPEAGSTSTAPVDDHGGADQMSDDYDPHPGHPPAASDISNAGLSAEPADDGASESPDEADQTEHAEDDLDTEPDDEPDDEYEQSAEAENDEPLRWEIIRGDPENPFTSQLIFTEHGEQVLWWELDPMTLNTLISALSTVKSAQTAVLTGIPETPTSTPEVTKPTANNPAPTGSAEVPVVVRRPRPAPPAPTPSWFARHRILTGFLILIGIFMLIGFVFGGTQV